MVWTPQVMAGQLPWWWWQQHLPWLVFVFCFGAAVGSFINVVNYRLPAGMSILTPPSRCPHCGAKLRFFRENLPILGWFFLRGRCRYCKARISPEYMIVEVFMALVFAGFYVLAYMVEPGAGWWGEVLTPWWYWNGFEHSFPAYYVWTFLLAGLFAMTVIDARTFTIPLPVPVFVTATAFVLYALQAMLPLSGRSGMNWPIVTVDWPGAAITFGGMAGVVSSLLLLRLGRLRYSFADYHEYVQENEVLGDYPHARREMLVELTFIAPILIGLAAGYLIGQLITPDGPPPVFVQALGATFAGYLCGGGLVWAVRILATLAVGREAMGIGDVHLLAAVGAALGWVAPIFVFFIAPFSGLLWKALSIPLSKGPLKLKGELPYGPHLAVATVVAILCWPGIQWAWDQYMRIPLPQPGLQAVERPMSR